ADGVTLTAGALIDVAGSARSFVDKLVVARGGTVSLSAAQGNVDLQSGSTLELSAGKLADGSPITADDAGAGTLNVTASHGTAMFAGTLNATAPDEDGSVSLDVGTLADFSALNGTLNGAGFGGQRDLRIRAGDVDVASGDVVRARNFHLTADAGSINVAGQI